MCECQNKISGMKRRRKIKVGPVEVGIDTAKNAGLALTGYSTAEYLGSMIGENVAQLSTTVGQGATKLGLATLTGVAALKSKNYKTEGAWLAGGMAVAGLKDIAVAYLPGEVVAWLPVTNGATTESVTGPYGQQRINSITMGRNPQLTQRSRYRAA